MNFFKKRSSRQSKSPKPKSYSDSFNLDKELMYLSPKDTFTIRDACDGIQVFGGIGSGKTSGSGATLAKAFLSSGGYEAVKRFIVLCGYDDHSFISGNLVTW